MTTNSPSLTNLAAAHGTNDIRSLKPPVEIPNPWLWVWWTLGVLVLAAILYFAWRHWRRKSSQPVVVPIIPPHVRAREKLKEALGLIGQPRPFCILVSDTIRVYLEERFTFHAPDRTTEEFLHELKASSLLLPEQKNSLGEFLSLFAMIGAFAPV